MCPSVIRHTPLEDDLFLITPQNMPRFLTDVHNVISLDRPCLSMSMRRKTVQKTPREVEEVVTGLGLQNRERVSCPVASFLSTQMRKRSSSCLPNSSEPMAQVTHVLTVLVVDHENVGFCPVLCSRLPANADPWIGHFEAKTLFTTSSPGFDMCDLPLCWLRVLGRFFDQFSSQSPPASGKNVSEADIGEVGEGGGESVLPKGEATTLQLDPISVTISWGVLIKSISGKLVTRPRRFSTLGSL
ncbi:unnamed protein product [Mycena citricolor]|uniref:Uncharacterized protein n=1 Tax=Mycena citricolor TaxID=2018698 RepID=A0AAD2HHJ3_9AGAR|nr:unnamed protein product [Mycena citricolor]